MKNPGLAILIDFKRVVGDVSLPDNFKVDLLHGV